MAALPLQAPLGNTRYTQGRPSCLSGTDGGCVCFPRGHIFPWLFPIFLACLLTPFLWEHVLSKLGEQESWLSSISRKPRPKTHKWTFWLLFSPSTRSLGKCLLYMSTWMFQRHLKLHMHKNGLQENFPFSSSFGSSCTHSFSLWSLIMPRIQSRAWIFPFHSTSCPVTQQVIPLECLSPPLSLHLHFYCFSSGSWLNCLSLPSGPLPSPFSPLPPIPTSYPIIKWKIPSNLLLLVL